VLGTRQVGSFVKRREERYNIIFGGGGGQILEEKAIEYSIKERK